MKMDKSYDRYRTEYRNQPITPSVTKLEVTVPTIKLGIGNYIGDEVGPGSKMSMLPTRMNIMRFVQDFCKEYACNGVGDNLELSEELILKELDSFFKN